LINWFFSKTPTKIEKSKIPKQNVFFLFLIGLSTAKIGTNAQKPSDFKEGHSFLQEIQESVGRSLKCAVVWPWVRGVAFFFEELACQAALSLTLSSPLK
jgi:hypothetical protein